MNGKAVSRPHWSFWLVSILSLIWYLLGTGNFLLQMNADFVASMPETHRAIIESRPAWQTASFGIAVVGGVLGCLLLLMRKALSFHVFAVSLAAVIVTIAPHLRLIGDVITDPLEIFMMIVTSPLIAVFLLWYGNLSRNKRWVT